MNIMKIIYASKGYNIHIFPIRDNSMHQDYTFRVELKIECTGIFSYTGIGMINEKPVSNSLMFLPRVVGKTDM